MTRYRIIANPAAGKGRALSLIPQVLEELKKHNLKFENGLLYAFREHDQWGRGAFRKTITYTEKKEYRDWRCDMNPLKENSFGLGIWPKGNTAITVKTEDWGCEVSGDADGKGRVWAFTII